jgi:hypothetical protein
MSGIGNRAILRALGKALGMEDIKQAPQELDTASVKTVALLDPGVMGLQQFQLFGAALSLAGATNAVWVPVGPQILSSAGFAATNVFSANGESEVVILGMRMRLSYSVAGAAADSGARMALTWLRQRANDAISAVEESTIPHWVITDGTEQLYNWSHPYHQGARLVTGELIYDQLVAMPPIYVPAGSTYAISLTKVIGGAATWPADTSWSCTAFGVACPKGMRPPFL